MIYVYGLPIKLLHFRIIILMRPYFDNNNTYTFRRRIKLNLFRKCNIKTFSLIRYGTNKLSFKKYLNFLLLFIRIIRTNSFNIKMTSAPSWI